MTDADLLRELARAEKAYKRASARADELLAERDKALIAALDRHSQTAAAAAMGVSRGRVGQLASGRLRKAS